MTATPRPAPHSFAAPWGAEGFVADLDGPVHWVRWAARDEAVEPPLVLVHGLGGSHLNWVSVGAALADRREVHALDLAGFGLTPGLPRDTGIRANAALLQRFLADVVGAPAVLAGNSMGAMVSAHTASAAPEWVRGLVLVDPALPLVRGRHDPVVVARFGVLAVPGLAEAGLRRMNASVPVEVQSRQLVALCFADRRRMEPAGLEAGAALGRARLAEQTRLEQSFTRAARSLLRTLARRGRYWRLLGDLPMPVLLVHGEADRLVTVTAAREAARRHPHWTYVEIPDCGHTPQMEHPEPFVQTVRGWLGD